MKNFILIVFLLSTTIAHAKFEIQTSSGYESSSDGKTKNSFSDMTNHIFLGAIFDNKEKFIIGQNISLISTTLKATNTDTLSVTELGPRLNYYMNEERNFFVAVAWNPYAKGTRKAAGVSDDVSGWSYLLAVGAILKMNNTFFLGGSINYHTLNITKAISSSNTASTVSNSYTSIMPMLNISLRFR
jgi:hypothetical protein